MTTTASDVPTTRETPAVEIEANPRRVRVLYNGVFVADSTRSLYVLERGHRPVYYFPIDDVRADLLEATDTTTHCPRKGDASYWTLVVGDHRSEDAVWSYLDPIPEVNPIRGHVAFYWDRVDGWFEEDEQLFGGVRNPHTRVDALPSSRTVEVRLGDTIIARTERPVAVFETGLPPRFYVPRVDVRLDLLRPSATQTICPYKGVASYVSIELTGDVHDDVAWYYPHPVPQVAPITDLLSFYDSKVTILVDGVAPDR